MNDRSQRLVESLRGYLRREGLKSTRQRELIVEVFSTVRGHVSVEELLEACRERDPKMGYATVYRTLKLLVDAGIALAWNFGEGFARYEPQDDEHHDHLFCLSCGRIEEFQDQRIEAAQERVAADLGYELVHHRHEIYGVCSECARRGGQELLDRYLRNERPQEGRALAESFRGYLRAHGLRSTRQREMIAELFEGLDHHVRVEDLHALVRERDPSVGSATVYRTLKLLVDAGLAACRHFGDGFTRFETRGEGHHDHLIDVDTGQVYEFRDPTIEARQEEIVRSRGFEASHHRHDLFGRALSKAKERRAD
jgi:Fur family ferric uptake transcriptional regulator